MATVLSVDGVAEVRQNGYSEFTQITPATLLGAGDIVRTGAGGTLNMAFLPNTLASLSEKTDMQISDLIITKDGNAMRNDVRSRTARLELLSGTIRALINGPPDCKSDLTIRTPHGELNANSDCVLIANVDNRRTRVTCMYGTVATRIRRTNFSVEAGYFQEFPSGDLSPRAAADDAQAQHDVMSIIETKNELQNLARRQRLLKPDFLNR